MELDENTENTIHFTNAQLCVSLALFFMLRRAVSTWKMARAPGRRSRAAHPAPVSCCRTCRSVASRSSTDRTATSRCRPSRCRATAASPAKGTLLTRSHTNTHTHTPTPNQNNNNNRTTEPSTDWYTASPPPSATLLPVNDICDFDNRCVALFNN